MAATRVLLADLSGLLGAIVRTIVAAEADLAVVAELPTLDGVAAAACAERAQVVVTRALAPDTRTALLASLGAVAPGVRLIALDADGQRATLATVQGERHVGALSAEGLVDLLRTKA